MDSFEWHIINSMRYANDREILKDIYYLCQNTVGFHIDKVMVMDFKEFTMFKEIASEHISEKQKYQEEEENKAKAEAAKMRKKK